LSVDCGHIRPDAAGAGLDASVPSRTHTPPTLSATLSPDSPLATDDLEVAVDTSDADGDAVYVSYRWTVDEDQRLQLRLLLVGLSVVLALDRCTDDTAALARAEIAGDARFEIVDQAHHRLLRDAGCDRELGDA